MLSFFKNKKIALTNIFSENFVDIHSHLLPGIDDGAQNMEESIALIQRMRGYGIKNFVTTPHVMEAVWENTPDIIQQKVAAVQERLKKEGLHDVSIRAAAEYMLDDNFGTLLKEKKLLTLKDNMILVELSYHNPPLNLYEAIFNIQMAGYKPVLAHPERYSFYHRNYKEYLKLKEAGCLFQLNLLSLSDYYGKDVKKITLKLLKDKLIDFVGSDTHHEKHLNALETIKDPAIVKLVAPVLKNNALFI